jgi:hypothetical protein
MCLISNEVTRAGAFIKMQTARTIHFRRSAIARIGIDYYSFVTITFFGPAWQQAKLIDVSVSAR